MKIALACLAGLLAFGAISADAKQRVRTTPPAGRYDLPPTPAASPADRAKSGWIEGASPWNPEGSSNPNVPTTSN